MAKVPIKVLIADDHEIFRDGLKLMLGGVENICLLNEARNGKELVQMADKLKPDVVITDIKMPEMDGVSATKHIRACHAGTEVIALSMFDDEQLIMEMLEAGAIGYLLKNSDKTDIIDAVNNAYMHQPYYCKSTSGKLAKLIALSKHNTERRIKGAEFSDREVEIIKLICEENTNKEIGEKLYLSVRTVEGYRKKILEKIDARNTVGIVIEAIRLGIYIPKL